MKLTQNQYYGLRIDLPHSLSAGSVYLCQDTKQLFFYGEDWLPSELKPADGVITQEILDEALSNISIGTFINVVSSYSELPIVSSVPSSFYFCTNSQGTKWLPGDIGGTYYPKGIYYSNGISWSYVESPYQSTQEEANEGIANNKFITPNTLVNHSKWALKTDLIYSEDSYVKYVGSIKNVDLGEYKLKAGQIDFDTTPTQSSGVASLRWNDTDGTLDLGLKGGNVTLQLGQESLIRVVNKTATNLTEAGYEAVYISGAQGQRLKVDLALANSDLTSAGTIGIVTENIDVNQEGFVTSNGLVRGINTTGSLQGETWLDGNMLYLSPTVAGRITNIKPIAPFHTVVIGVCVHAHSTQGSIFVKVDNGYELEELHNVLISTPLNNEILSYETSSGLWKNKSITSLGGVSGTGTMNYLSRFTEDDTIGNSQIIDNGTNILIGSSSDLGNQILQVTGGQRTYSSTLNTDWLAAFIQSGTTLVNSSRISSNQSGAITVQSNSAAYFVGRDNTNNIEFIMGTSSTGVAFAGSVTNHNFDLRANNTKVIQLTTGFNAIIQGGGTFVDNGIDRLQVTGTISASPATLSNQVVVKSQLDLKQDLLTNPITGTGTLDYLPKFSSAGTLIDSNILNSDNFTLINGVPNITGINPVTFQIRGNQTSSAWTPDAKFTTLQFNSTDTSGVGAISRGEISMHMTDAIGSYSDMVFSTSGIERFRVAGNGGNIGIGVGVSPTEKLTIRSNTVRMRLESSTAPTSYYSYIENNYSATNPFNIFAKDHFVFGVKTLSSIQTTYLSAYRDIAFLTGQPGTNELVDAKLIIKQLGEVLIGSSTIIGNQKLQITGGQRTYGTALNTDWIAAFCQNSQTLVASSLLGSSQARAITMQGAGAAIYHGKDLTNNVEFLMGCTGVQSAVVGAMTNHPLHFRTNNTLIGQFTISGNLLINSDVDNGVDKLQVTGSAKVGNLNISALTGAYGQIASFDTLGNVITNPNLKIINGVLDMSSLTAAEIKASGVSLTLSGLFSIFFKANGSEGMRLTPNQNLLIKSTSDDGINALQVTGSLKSTSSVQVGNSAVTASSANVGAIRYRSDSNNSYMDMVMQTGASTYEWVNVVKNTWT